KVCATFAMGHLEDPAAWPGLEKQVLGAGENLAALGAGFLVLIDDTYTDQKTGKPIRPTRLDDSNWKRLIDRTHEIANIAKKRFTLRTVFHPHTDTHIEYEDQIEKLLEDTDPELVFLCLDTGHHAYRGGEPVSFLRKHHKRTPYLHLKSVDGDIQKKVQSEG